MRLALVILVALCIAPSSGLAGLYNSREVYADLPSQWRGFLLDQRTLRQLAVPAGPMIDASPLRLDYLQRVKTAEPTTGDAIADLGAMLIRLGQIDRALEVLRAGQGKHPNHFAIAANLGVAWQLKGDLNAAAQALRHSVRLAPGRWLAAEELHLKLVLGRIGQKRPGDELDNLFGLSLLAPDDAEMTKADREKLTPRMVGLTQQLALWLPADGPLLWQLAEMANALGDVRTAANLMEGCVVQFGMTNPDLRRRRLLAKQAVEKLPPILPGDKAGHATDHSGRLLFRSRKPLIAEWSDAVLPPIDAAGTNSPPWDVFTATPFAGKFPPKFGTYLKDLDGKTVALNGFLQPIREDGSLLVLIESPVGCWYCEMPDLTGMIRLEPPEAEPLMFDRGLRRVVGRLRLNTTDPEDFLFSLTDARVAPVN